MAGEVYSQLLERKFVDIVAMRKGSDTVGKIDFKFVFIHFKMNGIAIV